MNGPNPNNPSPMDGFPQVGYLKNFIESPDIEVGDYTYYDDPDRPEHFEKMSFIISILLGIVSS